MSEEEDFGRNSCKAVNIGGREPLFGVGVTLYGANGTPYILTKEVGAYYMASKPDDKKRQFKVKMWHREDRKEFEKKKALLEKMRGVAHFPTIVDEGRRNDWRLAFYAPMYTGSIDSLRKYDGTFTFQTAMGTAFQCLEALESLHQLGYVSTRIHAGMFSVGIGRFIHMIYWTEFRWLITIQEAEADISERSKERRRRFKKPPPLPPKIGVKENLKFWFHLAMYFLTPFGTLSEDGPIKKEMFSKLARKEEMLEIHDYIFNRDREKKFDYQWIYEKIVDSVKKTGADISDPFDWEQLRKKKEDSKASVVKKVE